MATHLRCKNCGCLLAEWPELPPHFNARRRSSKTIKTSGTFWYQELYERLAGQCPNCGRKLTDPEEFREKAIIEVSSKK